MPGTRRVTGGTAGGEGIASATVFPRVTAAAVVADAAGFSEEEVLIDGGGIEYGEEDGVVLV